MLYGHELGLVPITTPAYGPQSNGLAEAFIGTFKRDYLGAADLLDAETVLAQVAGWFDDSNTSSEEVLRTLSFRDLPQGTVPNVTLDSAVLPAVSGMGRW